MVYGGRVTEDDGCAAWREAREAASGICARPSEIRNNEKCVYIYLTNDVGVRGVRACVRV